jgi:hypothetical protein
MSVESRMTSDDQWHRIRFPKDELISGAARRFFMNSLLPATEQLSRDIDLNTVAIFDVDDSEGGKYLYLSPGASAFLTPALAQGAQPCDRPAPESSLLYGDEWSARRLLGL